MLGLRTVIYKVEDMDAAKSWYSKAFGKKPYFDEPFYIGFNIGGYELGLQPEEESEEKKGERGVAYWGVDSVENEFARFIKLGAKEIETPQNVGSEIVVATVMDPWGNFIGLIYNPHFKLEE